MTGVGLEFAVSVLGGLAIGHYIDQWLGTEPFFTMLLVFGCLTASVAHLVMLSKRLDRLRRAEEEQSTDA